MPDVIFRLTLVGIAFCNFLVSLFIEVSMREKRCVFFTCLFLFLFSFLGCKKFSNTAFNIPVHDVNSL